MSTGVVRRAFVEISHGFVHCRLAGNSGDSATPPLLMLHGGPGSSAGLLPMITALAQQGLAIIAPDMMGNGQSDAPPLQPDIGFYANCIPELLDKLGVRRVDCYGHHVGAQVACELAIRSPERVRRLVLDGIGLFTTAKRREFLASYAPPVAPDAAGTHLHRLWDFLSATTVRFPYYSADPADRITGGLPLPPEVLTDQMADVLRNWRTYHLSYQAGFAHDVTLKLPAVIHETTVLEIAGDPLARHAAPAMALLPTAVRTKADRARRAGAIMKALKRVGR